MNLQIKSMLVQNCGPLHDVDISVEKESQIDAVLGQLESAYTRINAQ
jgi:hypothetical protein